MMIILVHNGIKGIDLLDRNKKRIKYTISQNTIAEAAMAVATVYADDLILWCHERLLPYINLDEINAIFHHKRIMASYNTANTFFLPPQLGYIDRTFFIKINKNAPYPTWMMSAQVGGVHATILNKLQGKLILFKEFRYFLNSFSKLAMDHGLFCYSDPRLLSSDAIELEAQEQASIYTLFKFVKQHHKWVWVYFLALSYLVYEKRFTLFPLLFSIQYRRIKSYKSINEIKIYSSKKVIDNREIDVIIPTIGRKNYLYDVLKDFSKQTILPKNIIIIEQNPDASSYSELDFLTTEEWPFTIKHTFTHRAGVCNARNIALSQVTSEWTLLGDDDNRFKKGLIEQLFNNLARYGTNIGITAYLQNHEVQTYMETAQTGIFGAGNGIIKSELIGKVKFDERYEFNYGEDSDFGNQLRHIGEDVIFFADLKIDHLKAPIGGYRTKVIQKWDNETISPKPSPTIQLLYQTYFTEHQILGYKLLLKFRSYKNSSIRNPLSFIVMFNKQWNQSLLWSKKL